MFSLCPDPSLHRPHPHLKHCTSLESFNLDGCVSLDGVPVPQHEPLSRPPRPNIPQRHGQAKTRSARHLITHHIASHGRMVVTFLFAARYNSRGYEDRNSSNSVVSPLTLSPIGSSYITSHHPAVLKNLAFYPQYHSSAPTEGGPELACRTISLEKACNSIGVGKTFFSDSGTPTLQQAPTPNLPRSPCPQEKIPPAFVSANEWFSPTTTWRANVSMQMR